MTYYLIIFFAALLFTIGLFLLKKPFFSLANSTTALLNTMLDSAMDESAKQKALIQKLGSLLSVLGLFLVMGALVVGVALVPVYLYKGSAPFSELDTSSYSFYLSMLLGSAVLFMIPFKKEEKKDYSSWSVLLHTMILDNYNISKSLFELDKRIFKKKTTHCKDDFVVVTGLARAGTTALTKLLHRSGKFHSLSYANMPFLLATNLWKKVYNPHKAKEKERAHGDKVMFGHNTIEALEEYFFKAFLNDRFIGDGSLAEHEIDQETYHNYLLYQNLVKPAGADTVYLAKNNNLILRYESLRKYNKNFKAILLFRYPASHAYSLLNQHKRFSELQEKDAFVLSYMNWLGHHEFGLNQKPFAIKDLDAHNPYDRNSINYWLSLWIGYYTRILSFAGDENLIFVDYEDLVQQPDQLLSSLGDKLKLDLALDGLVPFEKTDDPELEMDPELEKTSIKLYQELLKNKGISTVDISYAPSGSFRSNS